VGFSDITALHVEAAAVRVASIHGPNLTGLGRGDAATRERVVRQLEEGPATSYELELVQPGEALGRLCGGNLSLLHSCAAAGRLRLPPGGILLLEEVGERPYRIDRMLTTLVLGKHFDEISAVVIGDLERCRPGPDGMEAIDVACRCLAPLGVPVAISLPVGHDVRNDPVVLGAEVVLRDDGRFSFHQKTPRRLARPSSSIR
jgi:muramoyltetrapeptide carboxypeptidase